MGKLTALKVKALVEPGRYGDGDGLWLQVRDAEHRSWLFRYTRHGRARQMGLGELAGTGLADARQRAGEARALLRAGVDPLEARHATMAAQKAEIGAGLTFEVVAERFIAAHEASWRNAKHRAQWSATLKAHAYPGLGGRPVAAIGTAEVTAVLEPIWHTRPETASRLRGRIEQVLDYASARDWRKGDNPARWRGHLANILPARSKIAPVEHRPALPWQRLGAFLVALRAEADASARALELLILTACRTGEVLGARWQELDVADQVWTIPAGRMKAGHAHRVPLAPEVLRLIEALPERGEGAALLFLGRKAERPLSDMALTMLVRRLNEAAGGAWVDGITGLPIVPHGFRSTFRVWAGEQTKHPREVVEAALAHRLKDKAEAAYARTDLLERRRELMAEWATFCGAVS